MEQTILVRVTGIDGPGITAGILRILAEAEAEVLDMEQVVVRDHLNLGLLIGVQEARSPLKDLLFFGCSGSSTSTSRSSNPPTTFRPRPGSR
ncbi:MAG: ACT domain-containing protein [Acidimicrobiia bacterium]